ncbi:MAG: hypothetical protein MUF58_19950 [Arcicella sp.]|jgi:hypothetical protein|nr:hypothetical protein [Arcicella sp.]
MQSNFRDWTLDKIDEAFGLRQVYEMETLTQLITPSYELNDFEKQYIGTLQEHFKYGGDDWNEVELENKFISPMMVLAYKPNDKYAYFLERDLAVKIGEYELSGRVDGLIATGFRNPKKPFFCLNEYKKGTDPNGDPKGQALIAMLAAQELNNNQLPIYGCYVIGRDWYFMVLEDKKYSISQDYSCVTEEVFEIYKILKNLNNKVEALVN